MQSRYEAIQALQGVHGFGALRARAHRSASASRLDLPALGAAPRSCPGGAGTLRPLVAWAGSALLSGSLEPINFMKPICSSCSSLYNPHLFQMSRECAPEILNILLY